MVQTRKKSTKRILSMVLAMALMLTTINVGPETLIVKAAATLWTDHAAMAFAGGDGSDITPYEIATAEQLAYMAKTVNEGESYKGKYFVQTADIDLNGHEWIPIGQNFSSTPSLIGMFEGSYDGRDFEIRNMKIESIANETNGSYSCYSGLFGVVRHTDNTIADFDKHIKNINLVDIDINSTLSVDTQAVVGGLIGEYCGFESAVENCSVSGSLRFSQGGYNKTSDVGGFVGLINSTYTYSESFPRFDGCSAAVDITAWGEEIGGFAGEISSSTHIKNCVATGSITVDTGDIEIGRDPYVGGFFGWGLGQNPESSRTIIDECSATGDVTCSTAEDRTDCGGFGGGYQGGIFIKNCYSMGNVTILSRDGTYALGGGFIGGIAESSIENCYATGSVNSAGADTLNRAFGFSANTAADSIITNCAALGEAMTADTVSPFLSSGAVITTSDNLWYEGMSFGNVEPVNNNAGSVAMSAKDINKDGTIGGLFSGFAWTVENGKLPGLYGQAVDMPAHLITYPPCISGSESMSIPYGYESTSSEVFTLTGTELVVVTKQSGHEKITWDNTNNKLDIAEGLPAGSYPVVLTASNDTAYDVEFTFTLTVEKATPSYTRPTPTATYGDTLANVALPAGWTWEAAGTTPVGNAGNQTHKAKFTPADTGNYNTLTGIDVTVTVNKKAITVTADNKEKTIGAADPALTYTVSPALIGKDTLTGSLKYTGAAVGKYDIVQNVAFSNPNYKITFVKGIMTIKAAQISVTGVTVGPKTANVQKGKTKQFTATVTGKNNPAKTVTWKVTGNKKSGTKISSKGLLTVATNETAKKLKVTATSKVDKTKYATATVTVKTPKTPKPNTKAVPKNQSVKKGKKITLKAPKGVTLYYTINGKNPTEKSKKIKPGKSVKIKINKKTTVKVIAKKSGWLVSGIVKRTYKVKK